MPGIYGRDRAKMVRNVESEAYIQTRSTTISATMSDSAWDVRLTTPALVDNNEIHFEEQTRILFLLLEKSTPKGLTVSVL